MKRTLSAATLVAVTASMLAILAAPALADHPGPTFVQGTPGEPAFNSGGEDAEWDLIETFVTGNTHSDLDFFTQGGEMFVSVGTINVGPNAGGQTVLQLTEGGAPSRGGEVAPSFVANHPSASCAENPSAALGLQHDVEATPKGDTILNTSNPFADRSDAQLLIDATDAPTRCHDSPQPVLLEAAPQGGLELLDISDVTNPVEIHLTSHIGQAHTVNVDPKRPHIAFVVSSDSVGITLDAETGDFQRGNETAGRGLDGFEVVDMSSCMNVNDRAMFAADAPLEEKREDCRPEVFRFRYPSAEIVLGHTNQSSIFGCHELEIYPDDRLTCGSGSAAILFDMAEAFDDQGTPDDYSDDTLRGTPLPCRVRESTSNTGDLVLFPTDAMVTDCVVGEDPATGETVDLTVSGYNQPSLEGVVHLGSAHHMGRESATGAVTPDYGSAEDIDFDHEAELTDSRRFIIATDERGGGVVPPGASCAPNIDNPTGNGGLHAYAVERLDTERPVVLNDAGAYDARASAQEAFDAYARTPEGEKSIFRVEPNELRGPQASICTAHVMQQIPGQNRIFMGWYSQGTRVVDFTEVEQPDGTTTLEFSEAGFFIPTNADQWVSHVFDMQRNDDGTFTYYGVAGDFNLTGGGRNAIDVYQVKLPAPPEPLPPVASEPPPGTPPPPPPPPAPQDEVRRVAGEDRIDTAVKVSAEAFDTADAAVLARVDDYPDALAASGLAAQLDAPVLLTDTDGLDPRVGAELQRLGVERAYLAGGTAALSEDVEADLDALEIAHTRVGGQERYETAALIADEVVELGGPVDEAIVALGGGRTAGGDFPDALAAGNLAAAARAPIVLVQPDTVPEVTRSTLGRLLDDGATVYISGGPDAISGEAEQQLTDEGYATERLAGGDRYATAVAVTEEAIRQGAGINPTFLASGEIFQDALVAAPAARRLGGVMVLVHPEDINSSTATRDFLADNAREIDTVLIAGDADTVSDNVLGQVQTLISDGESNQRASSGAPMSADAGLLILGLTALPAAGLWGRRRRR